MQNVLIEKPYKFLPPIEVDWPQWCLTKLRRFVPLLKNREGVIDHEVRNLHLLQESISAGHGIVLTPNHSRTADPVAMFHIAKETPCLLYSMASWHLFHAGWLETFVLRLMGGFSVNREGRDRAAVDYAIQILVNAKRPLVIFAEGATSRTNDRLMALMDGPAFIARTAAKRRAKLDGGKVVMHPVAIKYLYQGDIQRACDPVLTEIERQLTWRPDSSVPLVDRVVKIGGALLALKEMEYHLQSTPGESLRNRQSNMVDHLLHPLEQEWLGKKTNGRAVATRIKDLRTKIFPEISRDEVEKEERDRRWRQLEDTYLAQQIDCYPGEYLTEFRSVDRVLETVEKFEEDLNQKCRRHGEMKVVLEVGEAIEVSPLRDKKVEGEPLMVEVRERLEEMLGRLQHESRMY